MEFNWGVSWALLAVFGEPGDRRDVFQCSAGAFALTLSLAPRPHVVEPD
jgi:hypothetical protein